MGEVVIDSRYVLRDHSAEFALKKESSWSGRDWSISDGDGNLVFRTESRCRESYKRTRLLDATGNLVLCFEKEVRTIPTYVTPSVVHQCNAFDYHCNLPPCRFFLREE